MLFRSLADQDTEATYRVLQGELDMYAPGKQEEEERQLENDMDVLNEFSRQNDNVDFAGRLVWGDVKGPDGKPLLDKTGKPRKQEYFNFGKYKGFTVADVLRRDPGYFSAPALPRCHPGAAPPAGRKAGRCARSGGSC